MHTENLAPLSDLHIESSAMNRSTGVTVSAVIAILGSALSLLFGVFFIVSAATLPADQPLPDWQPPPPAPVSVILTLEGVGAIGLGMIGIAFAIGLFKLHNWARIGFVIFASLLCFFAVITGLVSAVIGLAAGQFMPQGQEVPPGVMALTVVIMVGMAFLLGVLGTGWLVYFTRSSVKVQFQAAAAPAPRRGPLSPKVIAWLLIVGGVFTPLALFSSYPAILLGVVLTGAPARIYLALFGLTGLIGGIGILRWRSWGYSMAIAVYAFGLLNQLSFILVPGAITQVQETMLARTSAGMPAAMSVLFLRFGTVLGIGATAVPLWLLIRRRKAFLEACQPPLSSGR